MPRPSLEFAGHKVGPGGRATIHLPVPQNALRQSADMPVHVFHGRRNGPALFVCAAIHGDEINGVEIVRRLVKLKRLKSLAGTLFAIPVVNVYGFAANTRYLPDRRDLNRFFPGRPGGSLASELAQVLFENVVTRCQCGIDLHTGSNHRTNLPHLRGSMNNPETLAMARAFGAPLALDSTGTEGTLRHSAEQAGVRTLLYEAGEALRFDEFSIRAGLRGTVSVMEHLGMLTPRKRPRRKQSELLVARDRFWVRAHHSGVFRTKVKVGQRVSKDELLGSIHDPFGPDSFPLTAPKDGLIIGIQSLPTVYLGDAIMHIARFDAPDRAEAMVDRYSEQVMSVES